MDRSTQPEMVPKTPNRSRFRPNATRSILQNTSILRISELPIAGVARGKSRRFQGRDDARPTQRLVSLNCRKCPLLFQLRFLGANRRRMRAVASAGGILAECPGAGQYRFICGKGAFHGLMQPA